MKCPNCHTEWNERDEKEYNRITRKKKREQKELKMQYMKELRDDHTGLEFEEWCDYKDKEII